MNTNNSGIFAKLMKTLSAIEPNEIKATALSFLFVFILMSAYYLMRPLRDAMASDWSDSELSQLWTLNFFISTFLVALYGVAVSRIRFSRLVPSVYAFFAASFVTFYFVTLGSENSVLVDKSFYVWVSVFALFHISVFWSFMADIFNKNQASRLFAIIAAGASLGAIFGPVLSALLATTIEVEAMTLLAAIMLTLPIPIIIYLDRLKDTDLGNKEYTLDLESAKIGGNPLNGFKAFFTNPYLFGIGVFIILYTGIGTFVYFEQKNLLEIYDLETRTAIYASRDAIVNTLTYALAFFVTGRWVTKLGMPAALSAVPVLLIFGMAVLAFSPVLIAAVVMHIALRAGNYGLTRPAREMLFTAVDREERFKAKPVIDIVAYRGGDVIMAWFFTVLSEGIGLGLAFIAGVGAFVSAIWAYVGIKLGRAFDSRDTPGETT